MEQFAEDGESVGEASSASWANMDALGEASEASAHFVTELVVLLVQVKMVTVYRNWRLWTHRRGSC